MRMAPHFQPQSLPKIKEEERPVPSLLRTPKLELKPLPGHLKYIFLEEDETLPIIINAQLSEEEEAKVREVLGKYKEAIGWTLADIKGINPTICQHHIRLEDDTKPCHDPQRKLNPPMKESVLKEILKFLDLDIIYPVPDSEWVSPVHMVPKKSGVQVVEDEQGKALTKRLQTGWRMCIDYRKLNLATRKDHFPLPFIDEMLERLAGNQ